MVNKRFLVFSSFCPILTKLDTEDIHNDVLNDCEFLGNQLSEICTLLLGVKKFVSALSLFTPWFRRNSVQGTYIYFCRTFMNSVEISAGKTE